MLNEHDKKKKDLLYKAKSLYEIHDFIPKKILIQSHLAFQIVWENPVEATKLCEENIALAKTHLETDEHLFLEHTYLTMLFLNVYSSPDKAIFYGKKALKCMKAPSENYSYCNTWSCKLSRSKIIGFGLLR